MTNEEKNAVISLWLKEPESRKKLAEALLEPLHRMGPFHPIHTGHPDVSQLSLPRDRAQAALIRRRGGKV